MWQRRGALARGALDGFLEAQSPPRLVALKALRIETASEPMRKRFAREAEALARFSHAGIARVYSAEVVETHLGLQPIISMEYVDGETIIEAARMAEFDPRAKVELIVRASRTSAWRMWSVAM